jgi:hypothetical protein
VGHIRIAEIDSEGELIKTPQDGLDLLGNCYYEGFDCIVLHKRNITATFFDLKTCFAGELLQKFSNYRMKLFIIGSFEEFSGRSFNDFIYESNKQGLISFVNSREELINKLTLK